MNTQDSSLKLNLIPPEHRLPAVAFSVLEAVLLAISSTTDEPSVQLTCVIGMVLVFIVFLVRFFPVANGNYQDDTLDDEKPSFPDHHLSGQIKILSRVCGTVSDEKEKDHPLILMLGGFLVELSNEIVKDAIELPPKYYVSCFTRLNDLKSPNIYAVADLNSGLEQWTATGHSTLWDGVNIRIFHISWEDMFRENIDKFVKFLQQDSKRIESSGCKIALITSRETEYFPINHPLQEKNSSGKNLLIIGNSLIGGYINTNEGNRLYLQAASDSEIDNAMTYFNSLLDKGFNISSAMSIEEVKRKWLDFSKIGQWDPEWNGRQERDERYTCSYDQHINCWIPDYKLLINKCFETAKIELDKKCRSLGRPLKILEIGCGVIPPKNNRSQK